MQNIYLGWALGLTIGSYLGINYPADDYFFWYFLGFIIFFLLIIFFLFYKINKKKYLFLLLVIFFIFIFLLLGYLNSGNHRILENSNILALIYKSKMDKDISVIVEGRISTHPELRKKNLFFSLKTSKIVIKGKENNDANTLDVDDTISIRLKNTDYAFLKRDDYINISGNIGDINIDNFKGKDSFIFVSDANKVNKIEVDSITFRIFKSRKIMYSFFRKILYKNLNFEDASIAEAMILGNKNNVPYYISDNFKKSGVYHILAISGFHVSVLSFFLVSLAKKLNHSSGILWTVIFLLFFYNFLVGEKASMQRASIMILFTIVANSWRREYSIRIYFYFAYIIMILINPFFLGDLGFWMSFSSMAAIIFISPVLFKSLKIIFRNYKFGKNYIARIFIITLSIQIILLPILAHFFGYVSLASFISNVLIFPAFYVTLPLLFLSVISGMLWLNLGGFILKGCSFFTGYILKVVNFFGRQNFSILKIDYFPLSYMAVYYFILLGLFLILSKYISHKNFTE